MASNNRLARFLLQRLKRQRKNHKDMDEKEKDLEEKVNAETEGATNTEETEAEAQAALVAEMKEDVCAIDDVMAFFASEAAAQIFGKEGAQEKLAAAQAAKDKGEDTCICGACQAGKALLKEFGA